MILFGRKAHHLAMEEARAESCETCGHNKVIMSLFQQYFHMLWLPIFPTRKSCATQCLSCRKVRMEREFLPSEKEQAKAMKKGNRTPVWIFSGLLLMCLSLLLKMII